MAIKDLLIKIGIKGEKKAEKKVKKVDSAFKGLAKSAMAVGAVFYAARGVINGIKRVTELEAEQTLAVRKLETALGKNTTELQKQAAALQQVTTFGDETIIQGQAMLAMFIKDEEQLKKATRATLDLAAAKGMDFVQAADLVGKSVGSSTNALSRYGVAADGAVGSTERLDSIVQGMTKYFGGQAVAATDTLWGRTQQMSNAFGDVGETMGEILAPAMMQGAIDMKAFAESFNVVLVSFKQIDFKKSGENILKNTDALLTAFTETFKAYIDFIPDHAKNAFNKIFPIVSSVFKKLVNGAKAIAGIIWEPIPILAQIMAVKVQNIFIKMFNALKEQFNEFTDTWLGEKLGIEKITATDLIDTEGLEAQLGETGIAELLNKFFTGEDNIQNLSQFTEKQKEIWATYFNSVAVLADESEKKTVAATKGTGKAIAGTTELTKFSTDAAQTWAGALSSASELNQSASKENALVTKRAAQLEVIVNTASAIMNAAKTLNPAVIAGMVTLGAVQVAKIESAKFAKGGIVPGKGNQDTVPAMLTPGEVILNKAQQENLAGGMGGITINVGKFIGGQENADELANIIEERSRLGFNRIATHA